MRLRPPPTPPSSRSPRAPHRGRLRASCASPTRSLGAVHPLSAHVQLLRRATHVGTHRGRLRNLDVRIADVLVHGAV
ncbi:hypothetical protein B0H12DRAFT_1149214 [Mycena haematopus]|nr:hypothetical protein B0H12DRAFT_1149214 [Mycena haematopus]